METGLSEHDASADLWRIERELSLRGYKSICGVDEAGRGPLAGPVYAAAVILPFDADVPGLNDSKILTHNARERLFDIITVAALAYGVASASHTEIDEINILRATFLAMDRAVRMLKIAPDYAIVDGNRDPGLETETMCVVKGDAKSASVAAASILAKVSRDRYMLEMAEKYPQYMFGQHKGYGTKLHYERLREYGPSTIHRMTFLRKLSSREDG